MKSANSKIVKNTSMLYVRMGIVMIINIFSVRIILNNLGVIDYGIYDVVAGVVTMFASLSSVLSASTQRYLSIALGERKQNEFRKVFSSSINAYLILSFIVLIICESAGLWFINNRLVIPVDRLYAGNIVFQFALLSFIFSILQTPFSASIIAFEDINLYAVISLSDCVLKFLSAYIISYFNIDHLVLYGLFLCLETLLITILYIYITVRRYSECKYNIFDNQYWKNILVFSGWTLFGTVASVGMNQICTFFVNIFFGPIVNTARSIANQISSVLNSFCANILTAVRPAMVKKYAEGSYEYLNELLYYSSKAIFLILTILFVPLYYCMDQVLLIWLGVNDGQTVLFSRLMLIYTFILALSNPITIVIQATGFVKQYHIFVEIPTLAIMPITYVLYRIGLEAESTYYVMIIAILISHVIRLLCLKRYYPLFEVRRYIIHFTLRSITVLVLIMIAVYPLCIVFENSLVRLVMMILSTILLIVPIYISVGINKFERYFIIRQFALKFGIK